MVYLPIHLIESNPYKWGFDYFYFFYLKEKPNRVAAGFSINSSILPKVYFLTGINFRNRFTQANKNYIPQFAISVLIWSYLDEWGISKDQILQISLSKNYSNLFEINPWGEPERYFEVKDKEDSERLKKKMRLGKRKIEQIQLAYLDEIKKSKYKFPKGKDRLLSRLFFRREVERIARPEGEIYFITLQSLDRPIKIGYSKNALRRIRQLRTSHPHNLRVILILPGSFKAENHLHKKFSKERIRGEWFQRSKPLLKFISTLKKEVYIRELEMKFKLHREYLEFGYPELLHDLNAPLGYGQIFKNGV